MQHRKGHSLLWNLYLYDAHCSDPRDTIYALRGMSCDGTCIEVDYTKPAESVSAELAAFYGDPWSRRPHHVKGTPSWVPNGMASMRDESPLSAYFIRRFRGEDASRSYRGPASMTRNDAPHIEG